MVVSSAFMSGRWPDMASPSPAPPSSRNSASGAWRWRRASKCCVLLRARSKPAPHARSDAIRTLDRLATASPIHETSPGARRPRSPAAKTKWTKRRCTARLGGRRRFRLAVGELARMSEIRIPIRLMTTQRLSTLTSRSMIYFRGISLKNAAFNFVDFRDSISTTPAWSGALAGGLAPRRDAVNTPISLTHSCGNQR